MNGTVPERSFSPSGKARPNHLDYLRVNHAYGDGRLTISGDGPHRTRCCAEYSDVALEWPREATAVRRGYTT